MSQRAQWLCASCVLVVVLTTVFLRPRPSTEKTSPLAESKPSRVVPESKIEPFAKTLESESIAEKTVYEQFPELPYLFALDSEGEPLTPRPIYSRRSLALQRIQAEPLTEPLTDTILTYLRRPTGPEVNGRSDLVEAAIKNDLIEYLEDQRPPIKALTQVLLDLAASPDQPTVMRDYALQHMGSWAEVVSESEVTWKAEALEFLTQALQGAVSDEQHSFAGTALLSLARLEEIAEPDLTAVAKQIASDQKFHSMSRATALQFLAEREPMTSLALTQEILGAESPPELLVAGIALLGRNGNSTALLKDLEQHHDGRLKVALSEARKAIEGRLSSEGGVE